MEDDECFHRVLNDDEPSEADLEECFLFITKFEGETWTVLGTEVEKFKEKLTTLMLSNTLVAWNAAKAYCVLAQVSGSEAFRGCDSKATKALLSAMRRFSIGNENFHPNEDVKKKKRKSSPYFEEKEVWSLFFTTVYHLSHQIEMEDKCDIFIRLGFKLNSKQTQDWIESSLDGKTRITVLKALFTETINAAIKNELTKEKILWLTSSIQELNNEDYFLSFSQRLAIKCEISTQLGRSKIVDFISILLNGSKRNSEEFQKFCIHHLLVSEKHSKRTLGCELITMIFDNHDDSETSNKNSLLIHSLAERVRDTVSTVRCAALRGITQLANKKLFILLDENELLLKVSMEAATMDEKPGVRKWGVKVLSQCPNYHPEVVQVCTERCRDNSISVRKAALEALGCYINRYPISASWAFCSGLLLTSKDEEKSVSEYSLQIIQEILFSTKDTKTIYSLLYSVRSHSDIERLTYALLEIGKREDNIMSLKDFLNRVVNDAMITLPDPNQVTKREILWGAWLILEIYCNESYFPNSKILSGEFILTAWNSIQGIISFENGGTNEEELVGIYEVHSIQRRVLKIISAISGINKKVMGRISKENRFELGNLLLSDLASLERPPEVLSEMLQTLMNLCEVDNVEGGNQINTNSNSIQEWGNYLKQVCETTLVHSSSNNNNNKLLNQVKKEEQEEQFTKTDCALFLIGELALLGFNPDTNEGKFIEFDSDENLTNLIQALASPDFSQQKQSTRAFAFLTLGKLCLRNSVLAKRCSVIFVKELNENYGKGHEAVRSNSLIVLGDICRRFTNVVEPHIEQISKSLGDESSMVRKRCLIILAGLVQEEYVKLRSNLFFRFLVSVVDEDEEIQQIAKSILLKFVQKNPACFHLNASKCVFYLGGLLQHIFIMTSSNAEEIQEDEFNNKKEIFFGIQLKNLKLMEKRDEIYRFLFSKLDDAQKLETCNKMRRDVFGGLLDGTIGIEQFDLNSENLSSTTLVVSDTFRILQEEFAQVCSISNSKYNTNITEDGEEVLLDVASNESIAVQKATAKIIDALERKNVQENIVPLMVSLYIVSCKERSSLSKLVFEHLKYLYEKYNGECSSALAPHRDIQSLLQLEFKKSNRGKQQQQQANGDEQIVEEFIEKKVKTPKLLRKVRANMLRG